MRYTTRDELERIGRAGAYYEEGTDSHLCRTLSSFWMRCEKDDAAFTPHILRDGFWESWITLWFSQNVLPGSRFFDVGANVGYYSLWAAAHNCDVQAFEPNPTVARLIVESVEDNGFKNITLWGEALSDRQGKTTLWIPNGHSGAASIHNPGVPGTEVEVQTIPFDYRWGSPHETRPAVMKIDAEGAEPQIWAGMQNNWATGLFTVVLEWQRDRYDAEAFADELYGTGVVSKINTDGKEEPLGTKSDLLWLEDLEMIVVRPR